MTHTRARRLAAPLLAGAALVAGCGGGGHRPPPPSPPAAAPDDVAAAAALPRGPANPLALPGEPTHLTLTSAAIGPEKVLPSRYTCSGPDISPPLGVTDVPPGTAKLALALFDLDAPVGAGHFLHYVVFGIPPDVVIVPENELPPTAQQAATSYGSARYQGPCPPPGAVHHYRFQLYALRTDLMLTAGMPGAEAVRDIQAAAIAGAHLSVTYGRSG